MRKITGVILVPKECMRNLVISLIAVTVFICGAIVPGRLAVTRLDKKIREARQELDQRNSLNPLYDILKNISLSASQKMKKSAGPAALPSAPEVAGLKAGFSEALLKIKDISTKSAMRNVAVDLDFKNAPASGGPVAADLSFEGDFANLRTFLIGLGALPYVKDIQYLSIQRAAHGKALDFKTRITLAIG
ncbi:MAG: hypothetical protein M0Z61_00900 [Nitrospiraceae bacterium]|nr:hypothetical protein [Nitrospiraceae bacterium]